MRRHWTTHEVARLREMHGKVKAPIIARELGRTLSSVHAKANKLGICFDRRAEMGPEFEAFLRDRNAKGYSDGDIAAEWGAGHCAVRRHRKRLGLPANNASDRHKKKLQIVRARQFREAGVKSLSEVRAMVERVRAFERGWCDVSPVEGDILDQLEGGPKTRIGILQGMGLPTTGWRTQAGWVQLRALLRRGIVVKIGMKSHEAVYALAPGVKRRKQRGAV